MKSAKFGETRLVFFTIIVLVGLAVSSKLIYTELKDSIDLTTQAKIGLKVLEQLDKLNSSITYIERNEKPELISHYNNSIIEIKEGYVLAKTALDSLRDLQFQSEIYPFEIDSLSNFIKSKHQLSDLVIQLSLNHKIDSAIKIFNDSNDSLLVRNFYLQYNGIYSRIRKKLDLQQEAHIADTEKIYEILWLVIFIVVSLLLFSIFRVHKQLKIKDDLLLRNKTFSDIINFSSDAILILDLDYKITYCNKATEDRFNYKAEEIFGKDPDIQFQTVESEEDHFERRKSIRKYGFWMGELKRKDSKGNSISLHVTLNSFKDLEGNAKGYFSILSDITKLAKAQNEIKLLADSLSDVNLHLSDQVNAQTALIKDVFERVHEVFVGTDSNLRINYTSKHIESIFGLNVEDLKGMHVKKFLTEIAGNAYHEIIQKSIETNQNNSFDFKNLETEYWFEGNIYPSKNGISIYFKDITENVKSQAEILKSQKMYEFISNANESILTSKNADDLFQNICNVAVSFEEILFCWIGAPEKDGTHLVALKWAGKEDGYLDTIRSISTKDMPEGRGPSGRAYRDGKYYYSNNIATDDTMEIWRHEALKRGFRSSIALPIKVENKVAFVFTLYTAIPDFYTDDQVGLLVNIAENISFTLQAFYVTDLKKATDRQLLKILKAIEQSSASVVISDIKGNIEYVNPAFTKLTGYSIDEVLGQNPRILKTDYTPSEEYDHLWDNLTHKNEWSGEFCNKKKNGELYWEYAVISPVLNDAGEITNYVAVKENITAQKILQDDQRKLTADLIKRNQDLEKFSYILSHNIRGPLSNILGLKDALKRDSSKGVEQNLLQAISDSAEMMDQVIREITQIISRNKVSLEEKVEINFDSLLGSVKSDLNQFLNEKQAIIESDFSKASICISLESYFYNIFHHLIVNALKFSKKGITPKIKIWSESHQDNILLHFKDDGIGIDLNRYGKLVFGLYKRFNFAVEGRGVGLYLVKSQVDFLGGEIEIKSELNEWTEFIISLPI
jgi:PAS domain S-box-containing protein